MSSLKFYFLTVDKFSIIDQLPFERREFLTHVPATLFNFKRAKEAGAKVRHELHLLLAKKKEFKLL